MSTKDDPISPNSEDHGWSNWLEAVRSVYAATGVLPLLADPRLPIPSDLELECWQADDEELADLVRLVSAAGTSVERAATVLLCWFLALSEPWDSNVTEWPRRSRALLVEALKLLPVDAVEEPHLLKWELIHAASAGLWGRVDDVVRQWITAVPLEESEVWAAAARVAFLRLHGFETNFGNQEYWLAYGATTEDFGSQFATIVALHAPSDQDVAAGRWGWPMSVDEARAAVISDIASAAAKSRWTSENTELKTISAWCRAVEGIRRNQRLVIAQAGEDMLTISRDEQVAMPYRRSAARFSSLLFRQACHLDDAREAACLWTLLEEQSSAAWNVRAGVENQLGLPWRDSYLEFLRLSGEASESWHHTELMKVALEGRESDGRTRALNDLVLAYRGREFAAGIVAFSWPSFSALDSRARERWCSAAIMATDPDIRERVEDASDIAATWFAEAAAIELRRRVFAPFVRSGELTTGQLTADEVRLVERLKRSEKVTLGEMVELLIAAVGPRTAFSRSLAAFLRRAHKPLSNSLQNVGQHTNLRQLAARRNEAAHDHMNPELLRWVHRAASSLIDLLAAAEPGQGSPSPSSAAV